MHLRRLQVDVRCHCARPALDINAVRLVRLHMLSAANEFENLLVNP